MDPQIRIMHQTTYEAIWDAGYEPTEFKGKRTGFFVGSCYNDTQSARSEDAHKLNDHFDFASSQVPFYFDFKGVSMSISHFGD